VRSREEGCLFICLLGSQSVSCEYLEGIDRRMGGWLSKWSSFFFFF
jgi:hypothetical protein